MAKQFSVTLAKKSTLLDMATGRTWKKGQPETMTESKAAVYESNPLFDVRELNPTKAKAKPSKTDDDEGGGDEGGGDKGGGDEGAKKTPAKKKPAKKKA